MPQENHRRLKRFGVFRSSGLWVPWIARGAVNCGLNDGTVEQRPRDKKAALTD